MKIGVKNFSATKITNFDLKVGNNELAAVFIFERVIQLDNVCRAFATPRTKFC